MGYVSTACLSDIPRWDDSTNRILLEEEAERFGRGYVQRDYDEDPLAGHKCAFPFRLPMIPEFDWPEMIREREAKGLTNMAMFKRLGFPPLNQGQTSSCWMQATTDNMHAVMLITGGKKLLVPLSPASGVWPLHRRDVGGNCSEAAKYLADSGLVAQSLWPPNAINGRYDTPAAKANRAKHRIREYDDLTPKAFAEMVSMMLHGFPVAYGNYSMSHAVLGVDPIIDERGEVGVLARNSGYLRNSEGLSLFFGKLKTPHDAVCVRAITLDGGETDA